MEFFKNLEEILFCENPYEKIDKFTKFYAKFCENLTEFEKNLKLENWKFQVIRKLPKFVKSKI